MELMRELGVISVDLESSAFLTVGRRLKLKCCWAGVVSDRLLERHGMNYEGNIHSGHVSEKLLKLGRHITEVIDDL